MKRMFDTNERYVDSWADLTESRRISIPLYAKLADGSIVPTTKPIDALYYNFNLSKPEDRANGAYHFKRINAPITSKSTIDFDEDVSTIQELLAPADFIISEENISKYPVMTIANVDPNNSNDFYKLAREENKRVLIVDSNSGTFHCLGSYQPNSGQSPSNRSFTMTEPYTHLEDANKQINEWYEKFGTRYWDEDDGDFYIQLPKTINGQDLWHVSSSKSTQIYIAAQVFPEEITHKPYVDCYVIPAEYRRME